MLLISLIPPPSCVLVTFVCGTWLHQHARIHDYFWLFLVRIDTRLKLCPLVILQARKNSSRARPPIWVSSPTPNTQAVSAWCSALAMLVAACAIFLKRRSNSWAAHFLAIRPPSTKTGRLAPPKICRVDIATVVLWSFTDDTCVESECLGSGVAYLNTIAEYFFRSFCYLCFFM